LISSEKFLGFLLLMSIAVELTAMDLSVEFTIQDNHIVVDGRVIGLSENELLWEMNSGSTIRTVWVFRQGKDEELVLRYARRDPLGEGYLVYGEDGDELKAPVTTENLVRVLINLDAYSLVLLKPSDSETTLEARLYLDWNMLYPPMSLGFFWGGKQERSPWRMATPFDGISQ